MTNWYELETRASLYILQKSKEEAQRQEEVRSIEEQRRRESLAGVQEILERFNVRGILESVREDIWQEGAVGDVATDSESGLKLSSIVPSIRIVGLLTASGSIEIGEQEVSLEVCVDAAEAVRSPSFSIRDRGLLDSVEAQKEETPIVRSLIQEYGLQGGIQRVLRPFHLYLYGSPWLNYLGNHTIGRVTNLNSPESSDRFNNVIVDIVKHRVNSRSLPGQIRMRANEVIYQLSPFLDKKGHIDGADLRTWENQIRGHKPRAFVPFFLRLRRN